MYGTVWVFSIYLLNHRQDTKFQFKNTVLYKLYNT